MQRAPGPTRPAGGGRAVWRALGYLRAYRGETVGALLALMCVSAANLAAPQMIRLAIDRGLGPRRWQMVLVAVGGWSPSPSGAACSTRSPASRSCAPSATTFTAAPGQMVALLGTTGAGKSTVINLIPRFYDVTGGAVLVDGHDVSKVTLSSLRSQVGVVLQEALLFSGSVRDNIAYGRPDAGEAEVRAAAEAAQAHEFIAALPQGYDTIIGERGIGLSGGQRQRIAIARVLLTHPRLLILDDSTSAVDAETEMAIQGALDRLMRDRGTTAFVIAQRISTVRDADLILVLDEGQIVASGTHETLLAESRVYNEILGSQLPPDAKAESAA